MQAGNSRLEELYIRWFNKTATPEERAELIKLLETGASREELLPGMEKIWDELDADDGFSFREKDQLADKILQQWPAEPVIRARRRLPPFRWMAAAAVLLLAGAITVWQWPRAGASNEQAQTPSTPVIESIGPGRNGAILILADGREILLDSASNGVFASQGTTEISLQNNQLIYQAGDEADSSSIAYNTMATPRGRQFQLLLPDGTRVWLNAASSIRYPVSFQGTDRKVELKGEAYFEVVPDLSKPFKVETPNQLVQALGTSFNIHAFGNETAELTTLIEGSVKVNVAGGKHAPRGETLYAVLHPGQQANLNTQRQSLSIAEGQSEAAIAWKNGYFYLENKSFDRVMKQLERWYDIEVIYANGIPELQFYGGLSRNLTLDALIRALKVSEVHFRIEAGRRLIVYK
ncbi:FecR family protein [Pseudobacter ginsenosidimutans]|uniref:FecR family protein n=1 Tax=Pseudobacter ginsenosidimutans TaxID=661488 RepID=A0A4Q7N460_9BACT|nr:FecR family protein [Pseudobacter ginsenosidimutans]QEC44315.1 DUF4974 domain-containing protein [Pseudobacter ginsenosidimutans]RZS75775.1 FecR family protein [Pseudobacter ginsenosidimutans]